MLAKVVVAAIFLFSIQCTHLNSGSEASNVPLDGDQQDGGEQGTSEDSISNNVKANKLSHRSARCKKIRTQGDVTQDPVPAATLGVAKPMGTDADGTDPEVVAEYNCD